MSPVQGHVLIEIARVAVIDGVIADSWSTLVRPSRPIPPDASAVHGITDAMVAGAPEPAEAARALRAACDGAVLVVHNAPFDLPFVNALLRGAGEPPLWNPVVDTLGLARGLNGPGGNSLRVLAEKFLLPREPSHRALGDALTTARLFLVLAGIWQTEKGVRSLAELAAASQDAMRVRR